MNASLFFCVTIICLIALGEISSASFTSCPSFSQTYFYAHPTPISPNGFPRHSRCSYHIPEQKEYSSSSRSFHVAALPDPLISLFSSPFGSVVILAGIILVHEGGHYLAARSFGIKVEEFSIGIGPKLVGFKALGDEFNLRALPLGGYVRFPENFNSTLVRDQERIAMTAAAAFDAAQKTTLLYEILNIFTLGTLNDIRRKTEKRKRAKLRVEKKVSSTFRWMKWKSKPVSRPLESEILDIEDVKIDYYKDENLLQNRPYFERAIVLSGGIAFNLLLSFMIYFGALSNGMGLPRPVFEPGAVVTSNPRPHTASSGLLRKGDVIVAVNGNMISSSVSPGASESSRSISNLISTIRATPDGETLKFTVFHQGESSPADINIRPTRLSESSPQSIGVMLSPNYVQSEIIKTKSLSEGCYRAAEYVATLTQETAQGLLAIVSDIVAGKGAVNQVSGPIGLIKTGSDVVATRDLSSVAMFAAAISINLAVVNAVPLPALDGGQLLFVLSEAVSGRKIDQRVQEGLSGVTLLFLLMASVGAAFSDLEVVFGR